ncbi:hypothetical protein V7S43_006207 [Phytophthora oleae]|uniref:FH2 domain-containing protein n=1 Tax=Phytophthora oleae TaxID=2107226 RepID=A0ABD3FTH1_9STRA
MGVPRLAVENRMRKDGVNPASLDGPGQNEIEPTPVVSKVAVPTTRRRKWHLAEVPRADRAPPPFNGSIWSRVNEKNAHQRVSAASQAHIRSLFVRDIDKPVEKSCESVPVTRDAELIQRLSTTKKDKVRVMTGNKAVTLELSLQHITKPFDEVAKDVNILTAMYLQDTNIKTILSMWPNKSEQDALDEYPGDFEELGRCEQFLVKIRVVPMVKEKLQCLLLKMEIASRAEHVKQSMELVTRALNQICASSKFTKVIRLLRDFANLVNEEFVVNYKSRFSLESLLKMNHTKAFNTNITTIFDGFLDILRTEQDGTLVNFYEEINLVMQCKSVSVGGLTSEMNQLREGYQLVKYVVEASSNAPGEEAELAEMAFRQFADEIGDRLRGVQAGFDNMEKSHRQFVSWFEENPNVPLDHQLKAIAQFASDAKDRFAVLNWPASRM